MSLPESECPPLMLGDSEGRKGGGAGSSGGSTGMSSSSGGGEPLATVPEENDLLTSFLQGLGLEKYIEVFESQAVDYNALLSCSDEDFRNMGIK